MAADADAAATRPALWSCCESIPASTDCRPVNKVEAVCGGLPASVAVYGVGAKSRHPVQLAGWLYLYLRVRVFTPKRRSTKAAQ